MTPTEDAEARGYANGRARRDVIIRTASEHFAERGFVSATILEIAAACGISRAGLLHHFADKEALLHAVLETRDEEDQERFAPYVQAHGAIGVLRGMVDLADHNRLVPGLIELFVRLSAEAAATDHPAHGYFTRRNERIREGTARALRALQMRELVRADLDASSAALRLTSLMDGLQLQWLFDARVDLAQEIRGVVAEWLTAEGREAFDAARPALAA
ncbi:TetR/AcrR family transcriptional regulator [Microbacterium sp. ZW T5_56]|uniref:TetR/AcrR family transcriptional regulator n=1 Tax=Microbacterium sp. ZW T5_56 TaxID=3378081 RepID=UPI0038547DF5